MRNFYGILNDQTKADEYLKFYNDFKTAIDEVLWNESEGAYFDFKLKQKEQNVNFYPSNVAPLWGNCFLWVSSLKIGMEPNKIHLINV